ncbi:MAG: type II secretion system minor pseudopilin GspK [Candidatus Competibacteraceae bacterium]|nr:type II secretion system minor pseudopilin GspK [Candidatus Competibacteraceae bacterium]
MPEVFTRSCSTNQAAFSQGTVKQQGVALLTALLIVFLASLIATELAWLQQLAIRRSGLLQHQQQARLYTLGAEQWAMTLLARDASNSDTDHPGEDWAVLPPAFPVQGGSITGRIEDLQGRFNINNLLIASTSPSDSPTTDNADQEQNDDARGSANPNNDVDVGRNIDPAQFQALQRLLETLDLETDIAQAIADWLDPDQETLFPDGAEDGIYTNRDPAYLTADRPLTSISELRLIAGVDRETYDALAPYICALPPGSALNVNTVLAPVLAAASDGMSLDKAEDRIKERNKQGYDSVDAFLTNIQFGNQGLTRDKLAVSSRFFLLTAEANVGEGRAALHSILERTGSGDITVRVRSFGHEY